MRSNEPRPGDRQPLWSPVGDRSIGSADADGGAARGARGEDQGGGSGPPDGAGTRRDVLRTAGGAVAAGIGTGVADGVAATKATGSGPVEETARLTAPDDEAAHFDLFGSAAAVDGDRVLVGAPLQNAGAEDAGAAYLFVAGDDGWTLRHRFDAGDDARVRARFGRGVALDGDTALVGAGTDSEAGPDAGAVYAFEREGDDWTRTQKLLPTAYDEAWDLGPVFGWKLDLDGDRAVVAAPENSRFDTANGAATVYEREDGIWEAVDTLYPEETAGRHPFYLVEFGRGVALDGDRILVGAPGDSEADPDAGAAYVFEHTGSEWDLDRKLLPVVPAGDERVGSTANDRFGSAVDLDGDLAVVGAPHDGTNTLVESYGAVRLYVRQDHDWVREAMVTVEDDDPGGWFGHSVAIEGDRAVVGRPDARSDETVDSGAAYVLNRQGGSWERTQRLAASDPENGQLFGFATALGDGRAVVTDSRHRGQADETGAAYVFESEREAGGSTGGLPGFGALGTLGALGILVARAVRGDEDG